MTDTPYGGLEPVVLDPLFPEIDTALRRGRHIGPEDVAWYGFLCEVEPWLEQFYENYGCDLVKTTEHVYYLLPRGQHLRRRILGKEDMLVGQTLALLLLEPKAVSSGGWITTEDLLHTLSHTVGDERLAEVIVGTRTRRDTATDHKRIRSEVGKAVNRLKRLGFLHLDEDRIQLRPALMRFADPVRDADDTAAALHALAAEGKVHLGDPDAV